MQVQHEARLIESSPLILGASDDVHSGGGNSSRHDNNELDSYCLMPRHSNALNPIEHMACGGLGNSASLLAAHVSQTNHILIFDTKSHQRCDRFPLKAADKKCSRQSFQVSGLDFSHDGQRLAVGQTDCIIYIYKLAQVSSSSVPSNQQSQQAADSVGSSAGPSTVKPTTITGKFASSSPVTCLIWSELGILFGSQDGKVRLILSPLATGQQQQQLTASQPRHSTTSVGISPLSSSLPSAAAAAVPGAVNQNGPGGGLSEQQIGDRPVSQAPKVITIFQSIKGSMPISLAYKAPVLLIGQLDCKLQLLIVTTTAPLNTTDSVLDPAGSGNLSSLTGSGAPLFNNADLGGTAAGSMSWSQSRRSSSNVTSVPGQQQQQQQQQQRLVPNISQTLTIDHSCPPVHLNQLPNKTICCSGSDGRVAFHSVQQQQQQQQQQGSYTTSQLQVLDLKEDIMAMDYSPINEIVALITRQRLLFIKYDQESSSWRLQMSSIELQNVFTLSSIKWLRDGSQLAIGYSNCSLELFKCTWSKQAINDQLDICHIARNRIRITDRERNLLATYKTQYDIKRVNILDNNQNVLIWTLNSLLLARLNCQQQSEIRWPIVAGGGGGNGSGGGTSSTRHQHHQNQKHQMKFLFEPSGFVLIYNETTSECHLVKLGNDYVSFSLKLASIKRDLVSIRQFPPITDLSQSNQVVGASNILPHRPQQQQQQQHRLSSSRANSARQQQPLGSDNATIDELLSNDATQQQQQQQQAINKSLPYDSTHERFAYVSGEQQRARLTIIDLKLSNQVVWSQNYDGVSLNLIKFSFTSQYLLLLDSKERKLSLLSIKRHSDDSDNVSSLSNTPTSSDQVEQLLTLDNCLFADWLPETDSLVAQTGHSITFRYDLNEPRHVQTIDLRSFNYNKRAPLIDLSCCVPVGASQGAKQNVSYPKVKRLQSDPGAAGGANIYELVLSNGQRVPLDQVRRKFHSELALNRLDSALDLLERQQQQTAANRPAYFTLYSKLGWLALERNMCELALKAFGKLNYKSLTNYLTKCLQAAKEQSVTAGNGNDEQATGVETMATGDENQCELMLAKLRGDWRKFEQLAPDQEMILSTYKRLNKWISCLDYLTRTQQFRQRDIAEQEYQDWLVTKGRLREAAELRLKNSGDLIGALELLLEHKQLVDAGELLLAEQKVALNKSMSLSSTQTERKLLELANEICEQLTGAKEYYRAGRIRDKILGNSSDAIDLYLKAKRFELALELAQEQHAGELDDDKIKSIHLDYGNHLMDQFRLKLIAKRRALGAVDNFIAAGSVVKALEATNELKAHERAGEILLEHEAELVDLKRTGELSEREQLLRQLKELASMLLASVEEAPTGSGSLRVVTILKALELVEDYDKMIELLVETGDLKRAFDVSLKCVNSNDLNKTREHFIELAREYSTAATTTTGDDNKLKCAEQIYCGLLERADLAIDMYRQLDKHDKALELVELHQPDQFEGNLLQLARSLESQGRLEEAEKYLLRASHGEWTSVVRMYRLAQRWPDAYRVAHANCIADQDPLLVQLAYWWAKSLLQLSPGDNLSAATISADKPQRLTEARKLLADLNLHAQVVEFCCETKNYQFALDLLNDGGGGGEGTGDSPKTDLEGLRRDVVLRYATHLERQHKLDQAERLLVDNNHIELAARMYIDNDNFTDAIRVIESQLNGAVGDSNQSSEQLDEVKSDPGGQMGNTNDNDNNNNSSSNNKRLVDLLNKTQVKSAQKLSEEVLGSQRKSAPIMMQQSIRNGSSRPTMETSTAAAVVSSQQQLNKLQLAQQMYLRAQRPELAIGMYQQLGMWQQAIQVAQRFAPRLLEDVERALDEQVSGDLEPILRSTTVSKLVANNQHLQNEQQLNSGHNGSSEATAKLVDDSQNGLTANKLALAGESRNASQLDQMWQQLTSNIKLSERKEARMCFDKYLSLLIERLLGDGCDHPIELAAKHFGQLAKLSAECRQSNLVASLLSQQDNLNRINTLADHVYTNFEWWTTQLYHTDQSWTVWTNLRTIMVNCLECNQSSGLTGGGGIQSLRPLAPLGEPRSDLAALERRLLVAHFVANYQAFDNCLQESLKSATANKQTALASGSSLFSRTSRTPTRADQSSSGANLRLHKTSGWQSAGMTLKQLEKLLPTNGTKQQQTRAIVPACVELMAKLALALIRYADLLDIAQVLLVAGQWHLALGRRQMARQIWSALIELIDNEAKSPNEANTDRDQQQPPAGKRLVPDSLRSAIAKFAILPKFAVINVSLFKPGSSSGTSKSTDTVFASRLVEIRHWLLESLIGGKQEATADERDSLDSWNQLNMELPLGPCLICALPAEPATAGATLELKCNRLGRVIAVRREELSTLCELCTGGGHQQQVDNGQLLLAEFIETSRSGNGVDRVLSLLAKFVTGQKGKRSANNQGRLAAIVEFIIRLACD